MSREEATDAEETTSSEPNSQVWNWPNTIGIGRAIGSFSLIPIASAGYSWLFVGVYLVLGLSDWVDGVLARRWKQRTKLGAKIDSVADALLNICLILGVWILSPEVLQQEIYWIVAPVLSYAVASAYGFLKFGKLPIYHTYSAKLTHGLVLLAAIVLVVGGYVWSLRIAYLSALFANLESIAITSVVDKQKADVHTIFSVWPARQVAKPD